MGKGVLWDLDVHVVKARWLSFLSYRSPSLRLAQARVGEQQIETSSSCVLLSQYIFPDQEESGAGREDHGPEGRTIGRGGW